MLAGLGAVIMVSFFFSAGAQLYASAKERSTLESALGIVTGEVLGESTTSSERATEILAQQVGTVDEDPLPHADAFDVMVKLSEDIPMSMVHDIEELDVQKGHVVVHGIVGSIPDAQAIATSLRNEKCFQEVKITNTHQVVGGERQKYVLEFDLKCPEDVKTTAKKPGAPAAPAASGGGK
jgi:general secretion pathway protein L